MSAPSQSVFISYTRDDLAATRRIADALSAFEVEVWFDQDGLEGGDAWDQKIRRQVKECSLFIPIISAQTQARREAYFRLEWKLAEERTHLMAEGTAFLLPIAIDDTLEAGALVPESFRRTQWTRLPRGVPNTQFVDRVRALLAQQRAQPSSPVAPVVSHPARPRRKWLLVAVGLVLAVGASTPFWSRKAAPPTPAEAVLLDKSIAVLPFTNMSDDKENAYFADGVHEDLLTQLALVGDLKVTSRTSVAEYRDTRKKVRQIGAELGVATLLEGSVRRSGDQVRVTAQLIDVQSDRHLWAKTYDRQLKDVFAIQAELATEIAQSLQATLSPQVRSELARIPTQNMAAYELLLRQAAINRDGMLRPNVKQMIEQLQQAVKLDPGLAIAWARLGTMHARQIFDFQDVSPERLARAQAAINRALELAPSAPEVRQELGTFYYYALHDYARAKVVYGEILGPAPRNVEVLAQMGYVLRREGRFRDSNDYLEKVLALDPRHLRALGNMYYNYIRIRDFPGGQQTAVRLIALNPKDLSWQVLQQQAAWRETGRFDAYDAWRSAQAPGVEAKVTAIAVMDFWRTLTRRDFAAAERLLPILRNTEQGSVWEALFWRTKGDSGAARRAAEAGVTASLAALRLQPNNPRELAQLALLHAVLGEKEAAWSEYRRARELIPASRDVFQGADVAAYGPRIHAVLGERTQAFTELQRTLRSFSFESAAVAATDLAFAAWWDDPEFKAIVTDPANDALLQ